MKTSLTYSEQHPAKHPRGYVLFLHAFPLSSRMWDSQLEAVAAEGFYAIAPNVFGVEGSLAKEKWDFKDYVEELIAILDQKEIEKVTLVGLSMGGYQSFEFIKRYSERIKSLVLCDTRAEADTEEAKKGRFEFIDALAKNGSPEAGKRMLPKFFAKETFNKNKDLVAYAKSLIEAEAPEAIQNQLYALANRQDSTSVLGHIASPTLFIVGAEDALTPPDVAESMHHNVPGSELCRIVSAGHMPNLERPDAFNEALLTHLSKVW